ncbi:hypothetical protein [Clavibacter phaseoli]|uniref:hypothetical protein n=1 Tax=Clavibacter phaseoli TaxID=1734031 RepID=UPI000E66BE33|nr:hypothetical protein [Clavibacter phaseoli]RIJ57228.1 hypothetical protein DZF99_03905 [Clavibacter phaseoli]RIJ59954.1 hypothetical protein DZG03_03875 [Clavibacter phaseoli]UKF30688.1 hypothetical protein FGD69_06310 [Clavibacter phaseoli]UKF36606.1 hypothetical protein FGI33_05690 [Clavibacter phaseoli]
MPSLPLHPRPDRTPLDPASGRPVEAHAESTRTDGLTAGSRAPWSVPAGPEAERARWRDRRTGLVALVVVSIALWAVIAAAVGFATTM